MWALASRLPLDVARQTAAIEKIQPTVECHPPGPARISAVLRDADGVITLFVLSWKPWNRAVPVEGRSAYHQRRAGCAREVRRGNLKHRVQVRARRAGFPRARVQPDEQELETSNPGIDSPPLHDPFWKASHGRDLDWRRWSIQRRKPALVQIFPAEQAARRHAARGDPSFSREDTAEIKYLMKRGAPAPACFAPTRVAHGDRKLHLAVTVRRLKRS